MISGKVGGSLKDFEIRKIIKIRKKKKFSILILLLIFYQKIHLKIAKNR